MCKLKVALAFSSLIFLACDKNDKAMDAFVQEAKEDHLKNVEDVNSQVQKQENLSLQVSYLHHDLHRANRNLGE